MENVAAEDLATKFREAYELCLHAMRAKIKLPPSLVMNMEAEKPEEDARHSLEQLRAWFKFV